ncbi:MAG: GntR family transcriptional regulator [Saprospiraceae bacterium]|nr:GntR family transcriptional regulator [Saprospiraceae bacterium]
MITHTERNRVRTLLLEEMINGSLHCGDRLNLPGLAKKMDCSVTPVREALTQLEYSRVIESIPNRGFFIPNLDIREAKNLYDLIAAIEAFALGQSIFSALDLQKLERLQGVFETAGDPGARIRADMEFHDALTGNYENPYARQILKDLKIRVFFYEKSYMIDSGSITHSGNLHYEIIRMIAANDLQKATELLRQNWYVTLESVQKQFSPTQYSRKSGK